MSPQQSLTLIAASSGVATVALFGIVYATFKSAFATAAAPAQESSQPNGTYFGEIN